MQAVILAAGQSSRFYPFGNGKHKACEKLLGKSILDHTLASLKRGGISEVIIVTDKNSHVREAAQDTKGLQIIFVEQDEALGMGDALLRASKYLQDTFFVLHAHHVEFAVFKNAISAKRDETEANIVLLAKKSDSVGRFGMLKLDSDRVVDLREKPEASSSPSDYGVVGIYLLSKQFLSVLSDTPSDHYSFEQAIALFAQKNTVKAVLTDKETVSLKYPWDLLALNRYLLDNAEGFISDKAKIASSAVINGKVIIEDGVSLLEQAVIKGPCYIGKRAVIGTNSLVREFSSVGEGAYIGANMEIKNSVIMDGSKTHSGFIGDSVIGEGCKIAAFFCTGNVRLDRATIQVKTENGSVDTKMRSLGVCMGNKVQTGIRVSTMPGVFIGKRAVIGPSTTVFKHVPEDVVYYTKFQAVVVEKAEQKGESFSQDIAEREKMILFDIDYTLFDTDTFKQSELTDYRAYDEVIQMLGQLQGIATVGIFSEGGEEFQKAKLLKTRIHYHFPQEHLHIVAKKEESLRGILNKYKKYQLFMVDDKLSVLQAAKRVSPSTITIWIKRGPYAINQANANAFLPDATITSLDEVIAIVANSN